MIEYMIYCPNCGDDITETQFEIDESDVPGFIDIGYECEKCKLVVFTFKVEPLEETLSDDKIESL